MNVALPLVLNDGTTNKSYTRLSTGPSSVQLHAAGENYNIAKTVRIAATLEKRGGERVKRQIFEVNDNFEDTATGKPATIRAYLVLEVPIDNVVKLQVSMTLKKLLHFFSQTPSGGTAGAYVDSFINEELP